MFLLQVLVDLPEKLKTNKLQKCTMTKLYQWSKTHLI